MKTNPKDRIMDNRYLKARFAWTRKYSTCHCTCGGGGKPKKLYLTEAEAWNVIKTRRSKGSERLCPYKCKAGLGFHITHNLHQWLPGTRRSWGKLNKKKVLA